MKGVVVAGGQGDRSHKQASASYLGQAYGLLTHSNTCDCSDSGNPPRDRREERWRLPLDLAEHFVVNEVVTADNALVWRKYGESMSLASKKNQRLWCSAAQ
jgi:hypothetical protein